MSRASISFNDIPQIASQAWQDFVPVCPLTLHWGPNKEATGVARLRVEACAAHQVLAKRPPTYQRKEQSKEAKED